MQLQIVKSKDPAGPVNGHPLHTGKLNPEFMQLLQRVLVLYNGSWIEQVSQLIALFSMKNEGEQAVQEFTVFELKQVLQVVVPALYEHPVGHAGGQAMHDVGVAEFPTYPPNTSHTYELVAGL